MNKRESATDDGAAMFHGFFFGNNFTNVHGKVIDKVAAPVPWRFNGDRKERVFTVGENDDFQS